MVDGGGGDEDVLLDGLVLVPVDRDMMGRVDNWAGGTRQWNQVDGSTYFENKALIKFTAKALSPP